MTFDLVYSLLVLDICLLFYIIKILGRDFNNGMWIIYELIENLFETFVLGGSNTRHKLSRNGVAIINVTIRSRHNAIKPSGLIKIISNNNWKNK